MIKSLLPALFFFFGTPLSLPILAGESSDMSSCSQAATTPAAGGNKTSSAPKPPPAPTRRPAPAPSKFLFM